MLISTLPRTIIKAGFNGLRLPLTALEKVSGKGESDSWPPTLAFETFEANAKRLLGTVLRDDDLTREGTLQQAKVIELAEAERLESLAAATRAEADAALEQERERLDEARDRIADQAAAHERELAQEKLEKERDIREATRKREQTVAMVSSVRERAVTEQERAAERTRIAEESAALAKKGAALSAQRKAQSVDKALEAKKAKRKSG